MHLKLEFLRDANALMSCMKSFQVVIINITRRVCISVSSAIRIYSVQIRNTIPVAVGRPSMMSLTRVKSPCIVMPVYQVIFDDIMMQFFCTFLHVCLYAFLLLSISIAPLLSVSVPLHSLVYYMRSDYPFLNCIVVSDYRL